jgi:glycosyltransferase involved in cell wall biosynthesis
MIGRGYNKLKRFNLGINAMEYIIKEDSKCEMKIISIFNKTNDLQNLVYNLNLENQIKFIGYSIIPDLHFRNASLHIFPSISESFGMVLIETKIFGIPNILLGLDYIILSEGGTIIIYDENPEAIAKESLKILKNENLRKKLGNEARLSIRKINNKSILKKWIKLILSVYNGDIYYQKLVDKDSHDKHLFSSIALKILNNQLNLFKKRKSNFQNLNLINLF